MKINEQWAALKEETHANIQSNKGISNRQVPSIQIEDPFGDIKENKHLRRFHCRTSEKMNKKKRKKEKGKTFFKDKQMRKRLIPFGMFLFGVRKFEIGINRQPLV